MGPDDHKFIAADTVDLLFLKMLCKDRAQPANHLVAHIIAHIVVDPFQAVDIQKAHAGGKFFSQKMLQHFVIGNSVAKACQGIVIAFIGELLHHAPTMDLVGRNIADLHQKLRGIGVRMRIVHPQKAVKITSDKNWHDNKIPNAPLVQAVVGNAARGVIFQRFHIVDDGGF